MGWDVEVLQVDGRIFPVSNIRKLVRRAGQLLLGDDKCVIFVDKKPPMLQTGWRRQILIDFLDTAGKHMEGTRAVGDEMRRKLVTATFRPLGTCFITKHWPPNYVAPTHWPESRPVEGILRNKSNEQGQAFLDYREEFLSYIESYASGSADIFFSRFIDLVNFLGTSYPGLNLPEQRARWLIRFNTLFGMSIVHPKLVQSSITPTRVIELMTEIENTNVSTQPAFLQYVAAHEPAAFLDLDESHRRWTGDGKPSYRGVRRFQFSTVVRSHDGRVYRGICKVG